MSQGYKEVSSLASGARPGKCPNTNAIAPVKLLYCYRVTFRRVAKCSGSAAPELHLHKECFAGCFDWNGYSSKVS